MPAAVVPAFGDRGLHLGRGVSREELQFGPQFGDFRPQRVVAEVGVAQRLADADRTAQRRAAVVDAVLLRIADEFYQERRHDDAARGADAPDGVPLQFGDAVPHADHAASQLSGSHEVSQPGHEAAVDGRHQLQDVLPGASRRGERHGLVVGQPGQVFFREGERHRVAEGSRRGHVVDDAVAGYADELPGVQLQIRFGGYGQAPQVVRRADVARLHAAAVEHAPVVRRIFIEVGDLFAQAFLLERRDRIGRCELYLRVSYHGLHSDLSLSIARSSSLRGTPASSALPKLCAARPSSPCER